MSCPHHIHRAAEGQPRAAAQSHRSTIWVRASGAILTEREKKKEKQKKKKKKGAQTSQAHMDPSIQPWSHPPPSAAAWDPDAMNSSETQIGANP